MFTIQAPAKINLVLEVLGRRSDGYHEIRSVMQTLDLCDTLRFSSCDGLHLVSNEPSLRGPTNLVTQVAELLRHETGTRQGARVELTKRIPIASGLGGGSSDAAAALLGLNRLWGLGLSDDTLSQIGARVGSDVPFFLVGGTALVEGRGERVRPLPQMAKSWVVLVIPDVTLPNKTRMMYGKLGPTDYSDGSTALRLVGSLQAAKPIAAELLANSFERVAFETQPEIAKARQAMIESGLEVVRLSGAGPALFSLVRDQDAAEAAVSRLWHEGYRAILTKTS